MQQQAKELGTKVFMTPIRECVKTREAQDARKLLLDYAPKCTSMQDYESFVEELIG